MSYDPKKLIALKKNIDRYLRKHDQGYRDQMRAKKEEKKFRAALIKQLGSQNDQLVKELKSTIGGLASKLDTVLLQKLLSAQADKADPIVAKELRRIAKSFPKITEKELGTEKVIQELRALQAGVKKLASKEIKIPEPKPFPTTFKVAEFASIEKGLRDILITLKKSQPKMGGKKDDDKKVLSAIKNLTAAIKKIKVETPEIEFPESISIDNFPPQKIPQPVTNININGLRGPVKSSQISVLTTATKIPDTPLTNRRSLIVFNNSTRTVYLGGSSVTIASGTPIPSKQYSPPMDLSATVDLYGIASASSDVRVLEASTIGVGA